MTVLQVLAVFLLLQWLLQWLGLCCLSSLSGGLYHLPLSFHDASNCVLAAWKAVVAFCFLLIFPLTACVYIFQVMLTRKLTIACSEIAKALVVETPGGNNYGPLSNCSQHVLGLSNCWLLCLRTIHSIDCTSSGNNACLRVLSSHIAQHCMPQVAIAWLGSVLSKAIYAVTASCKTLYRGLVHAPTKDGDVEVWSD